MVAHLSRALLLIALPAVLPVQAQGMSDPTHPPREITGEPGDPGASAGGSPAQVVVISSDRHQATINGRTVALGGRYGDATLVRISDQEIVLQRPDSTETIRLYSSVNRRMRSSQEGKPTNAAEGREE